MIKLKDILLEGNPPSIFVPRRMEDRVERMISLYVRNGSKGDLELSKMNLTVLPDILKNVTVGRDFFCGSNKLTSLKNAPETVGRDFFCDYNDLTSLQGAPEYVGGSFYCSRNNLTKLINTPKFVGGSFYCSSNSLNSLTGAPTSVGGNFNCSDNPVQFTIKDVKSVCDVKGKIFV
jgi:hypothetical protein